jgi:hypothetical protein
MDTMPRLETDLLAELITRKHVVLSQLHQLSQRQLDIVATGDMTQLLAILAAKQKLLNALQEVERKLDPFRAQNPEGRNWRSPELRQKIRRTAEASEALLKQIMELEQQSESQLVSRRDTTAQRLQGTHGAWQASQAYAGCQQPRQGQLDLSSER